MRRSLSGKRLFLAIGSEDSAAWLRNKINLINLRLIYKPVIDVLVAIDGA